MRGRLLVGWNVLKVIWGSNWLALKFALEHAHPVGHLAHDAEIVSDEQHRHVEFRFELEQQVEDLRLDGHVERGGRLIGDQQVRLVGERHGDHHPLPLAARELMRIGVEAPFGSSMPTLSRRSSTRACAALLDKPR